jgi:hypothetical protein
LDQETAVADHFAQWPHFPRNVIPRQQENGPFLWYQEGTRVTFFPRAETGVASQKAEHAGMKTMRADQSWNAFFREMFRNDR